MSASHSQPMGAGNWEPPFGQSEELTRMIRSLLDERGPLPFGVLYPMVRGNLGIEPGTLHDHLNNLLAAGLLTLAPTGFYLLP